MSEESKTCANPKRFLWLRWKLRQIDWFVDSLVWVKVARWTRKYDEDPHYNRFLGGVYEFAWTKFCGYGWRFAAHCGAIHWGLARAQVYNPVLLPVDIGEHLGKPGKIVWPEEKAN